MSITQETQAITNLENDVAWHNGASYDPDDYYEEDGDVEADVAAAIAAQAAYRERKYRDCLAAERWAAGR